MNKLAPIPPAKDHHFFIHQLQLCHQFRNSRPPLSTNLLRNSSAGKVFRQLCCQCLAPYLLFEITISNSSIFFSLLIFTNLANIDISKTTCSLHQSRLGYFHSNSSAWLEKVDWNVFFWKQQISGPENKSEWTHRREKCWKNFDITMKQGIL